jgi:PAS domain S-box-containing protein
MLASIATLSRELRDVRDSTAAWRLAANAARRNLETPFACRLDLETGAVAHASSGPNAPELPEIVDISRIGESGSEDDALYFECPLPVSGAEIGRGIAVPVAGNEALAVLYEGARSFDPDELDMLRMIASMLAMSVHAGERDEADVVRAELEERLKEHSCLLQIGRILSSVEPFAPERTWEEALWSVVRTVPSGWRFPEALGVRLTLNGRSYTAGFASSSEVLSADITSGDSVIGRLDLSYTEAAKPPLKPDESTSFFAEEAELLREIAGRIAAATESRFASAALANSELRFRQLAENSRDVFWIRSASDGSLEYVSPAFDSIWPEQEHQTDLTRRWLAGIHPEDRDAYARGLGKLFRGGELEVEYRVVDNSGAVHWIRDKASAIKDKSGAVAWVGGVARDWTDQQRMREARENERLLAIIHASPVGMLIADRMGRILLINQEGERILDRKQAVGAHLDDRGLAPEMLYPDGTLIPNEKRPLNRALHNGETVRADEVLYRHGDRTLTTLTNTTPFYDPEGRVTGAIAVIQDVSHFEELERLRGEFLAMISHELRTPLTIIKGSAMLGLSARPEARADMLHYFDLIDRQSDHLKGLLDNLLDMTSIEAGRLAINPRPTDLSTLLSGAIAAARQAHLGWSFELQLDESLPQVMVDEGRILQVVHNLLTNACKFSSVSSTVRVSATRDGEQVLVSVTDEGEGIDAEDLATIFGKFNRSVRSAEVEGLGLGLAISKGLVEAHGGRIWGESDGAGHGSTFSFTLPVIVATTSAEPVRVDASHLTVLALDDEPQILKYLQRCLGEQGYAVRSTFDAEEALQIVADGGADLVLLDLFLGARSGFDILQQIRSVADLPVIILTGSNDDENAVQALKLGADDYVRKPFHPAELDARIQAVLRRRARNLPAQAPLEIDGLRLDLGAREVEKDGARLELSATEYRLLVELVLNAGRVLTHKQLLEAVWGPEYSTEVSLIRPYIKSLRKKLGDDVRSPHFIFTERHIGYRFRK